MKYFLHPWLDKSKQINVNWRGVCLKRGIKQDKCWHDAGIARQQLVNFADRSRRLMETISGMKFIKKLSYCFISIKFSLSDRNKWDTFWKFIKNITSRRKLVTTCIRSELQECESYRRVTAASKEAPFYISSEFGKWAELSGLVYLQLDIIYSKISIFLGSCSSKNTLARASCCPKYVWFSEARIWRITRTGIETLTCHGA